MQIKDVIIVAKLGDKEMWHYPRSAQTTLLKKIKLFLTKKRIRYRILERSKLRRTRKTIEADLLMTLGGDGTFLTTSHHTKNSPLLGINSSPKSSTGFFCLATPKNFEKVFQSILDEKKKLIQIPRIQISVGKKKLPYLILNDVLFANTLPGDTSRYILKIGKKREEQKSSGIWIATGAGSTAAIFSAGGKRLSITSQKIQYRVREPFRYPKMRYRLVQGTLSSSEKIKILSDTDHAYLFLDGHSRVIRLNKGNAVTLQGGGKPLSVFF